MDKPIELPETLHLLLITLFTILAEESGYPISPTKQIKRKVIFKILNI